ncbi:hypothetical protein EVAR_102350_1 [Eumeta japonica]|uniref:Uncharacterized protein n=1 Tax=Eumeta variegata TaxID=151549 RepID=A0A4C1XLN4_EUMVA|nr:hypothetical protein EVAR_102350_1 [Eumeta japonica]
MLSKKSFRFSKHSFSQHVHCWIQASTLLLDYHEYGLGPHAIIASPRLFVIVNQSSGRTSHTAKSSSLSSFNYLCSPTLNGSTKNMTSLLPLQLIDSVTGADHFSPSVDFLVPGSISTENSSFYRMLSDSAAVGKWHIVSTNAIA